MPARTETVMKVREMEAERLGVPKGCLKFILTAERLGVPACSDINSSLYDDEDKMTVLPPLLTAVFCFLVACGIFNNSFEDTLKLELDCGDDDNYGVAANDDVEIVWLGMVTFGIRESDIVGLPIVTEVF
ncbi:hypothetical protein QE152_g13479 [Popillia japonica]|uniref:Uncharacterized protein n=1 Tax=Popillia japonica TaxID=7064 RepID=A0AAW1LCN4_POPJA